MRHVLQSAGRGKRVARHLRHAYATFDHALSHTASLDLTARLYGYRSWRECQAEIGRISPSRSDEDAGAEIAEIRRGKQEACLVADGRIDPATARALIGAIRPTGAARTKDRTTSEFRTLMRSPAGMRDLLMRLARNPSAELRDLKTETRTCEDGVWEIVSWIKLPSQFRKALAVSPTGEALYGTYESRRADGAFDALRESSATWHPTTITDALRTLGFGPQLVEAGAPSVAPHPQARGIAAALQRLDVEILTMFRTGEPCSLQSYNALRSLPRTPGSLRDLLVQAPLLAGCVGTLASPTTKDPGDRLDRLSQAEDALTTLAEIQVEDRGFTPEHARAVLDRLRGQDPALEDGLSFFSLDILMALPISAVPSDRDDWLAMEHLVGRTAMMIGPAMPAPRLYAALCGNDWATLHACWPRENGLFGDDAEIDGMLIEWTASSLGGAALLAFCETYGLDSVTLEDSGHFAYHLDRRILQRIVPEANALTRLRRMNRYLGTIRARVTIRPAPPSRGYAEIMADAAEILPADLRGLAMPDFLRALGYDPVALSRILAIDPGHPFDDAGDPVGPSPVAA